MIQILIPALLLTLAVPVAAETAPPVEQAAAQAAEQPAEAVTGEAIYRHCIACHGKQGAGGDGGKYPRIAALPADYIDKQLHDFKQRRRINKPMLPIFGHHRFNDEVIATVAAHIAALPTPGLALWPYQPDPAALAAYPSRTEFAAAGAARYAAACSSCHGADAGGDPAHGAPPLIDQYPAYLAKQLQDFSTNQRRHPASGQCGALEPAEADAVIDHLVELGKG